MFFSEPAVFIDHLSRTKKVLIYGFGKEGRATYSFFKKHFPEKELVIHDDNIEEFNSTKNLRDFDLIVTSPSIPRSIFEKIEYDEVNSLSITSGTEIFLEYIGPKLRQKIIGVTGTKGKSTTVKFTSDFLTNAGYKVITAGNYGVPLLSIYDEFVKHGTDYLVVEFSSYQLEKLHVSPHIAIFLNLYPDHLDHHGSLEEYFIAKQNIWKHQTDGDYLIVPKDMSKYDPLLQGYFVNHEPANLIKSKPLAREFFSEKSVFRGSHFLDNFGAVLSLARILRIEESVFRETCLQFVGLEHRSEIINTRKGVVFVNDANATTPDAALASINNFSHNLDCIILGGKDRGYSFEKLVSRVIDLGLFVIILESESGKALKNLFKNKGYTKFVQAKNMENIVKLGFNNTAKGKVCLLSMGSPSYGYFKNFEEKGNLFKELIKELDN